MATAITYTIDYFKIADAVEAEKTELTKDK